MGNISKYLYPKNDEEIITTLQQYGNVSALVSSLLRNYKHGIETFIQKIHRSERNAVVTLFLNKTGIGEFPVTTHYFEIANSQQPLFSLFTSLFGIGAKNNNLIILKHTLRLIPEYDKIAIIYVLEHKSVRSNMSRETFEFIKDLNPNFDMLTKEAKEDLEIYH